MKSLEKHNYRINLLIRYCLFRSLRVKIVIVETIETPIYSHFLICYMYTNRYSDRSFIIYAALKFIKVRQDPRWTIEGSVLECLDPSRINQNIKNLLFHFTFSYEYVWLSNSPAHIKYYTH
jgi:hypothetical protein